MIKRGMSPAFSAAVTASSSVISPIIPPGIGLIIYAFIANASVGKMFIAGYVPGLMMCIALMITVSIVAKRRGYEPTRERRASFGEIFRQFRHSSWALFLPFGIILGLRFGMFTPTEAGAMTVVYSLIVGFFVYKELRIEHLPTIIVESVLGTAAVMLIICAASAFGYYMSWEQLPQKVTEHLLTITKNPMLLLLIINAFLLFIGMFIEGTASLIILTPLFVPALAALGIDPIHFGIVMVVNLTIGGVTPPFGTLMFLVCSILNIPLTDFIKEVIPFIIALIIVLFIITFIPGLVTFLPNLIMK
jgi:tripartite ATP-independent transporter DctM subunit